MGAATGVQSKRSETLAFKDKTSAPFVHITGVSKRGSQSPKELEMLPAVTYSKK
jgi:hypothetical protein